MLNRLKQKYFIKSNPPNKDHNEVSFAGITPILIVVIIGVLISLLILIIELSYRNYSKFVVKKKLYGRKTFDKTSNTLFRNNFISIQY